MDFSIIVGFCHNLRAKHHVAQLTELVLIHRHGTLQNNRNKTELSRDKYVFPEVVCKKRIKKKTRCHMTIL